jgi:hypothetical protein
VEAAFSHEPSISRQDLDINGSDSAEPGYDLGVISTDHPTVEMELPGLAPSQGLVSSWRTRQNAGHSIYDGAGAPLRHRRTLDALRAFDPVQVAQLEAGAWAAYYRRDWLRFIVGGLICARRTFALSWPDTLMCSWLVMRANQHWAPYPDNNAAAAHAAMTRFYAILRRRYGVPVEPARAAVMDMEWWRIHRELQHGEREDAGALVDALIAFWQQIYPVATAALIPAARERAFAMTLSDSWILEGCQRDSPRLAAIRSALVASYAALRDAVSAEGA